MIMDLHTMYMRSQSPEMFGAKVFVDGDMIIADDGYGNLISQGDVRNSADVISVAEAALNAVDDGGAIAFSGNLDTGSDFIDIPSHRRLYGRGCRITGDGTTYSLGILNKSDILIDGLVIHDDKYGILGAVCDNVTIQNCIVHSHTYEGIYLKTGEGYAGPCTNCKLLYNNSYSNGRMGISIESSANSLVSGNIIHDNVSSGLHMEGTDYKPARILNNHIYDNGARGILVTTNGYGAIIAHNEITTGADANMEAIFAGSSMQYPLTIVGNRIYGATSSPGIYVVGDNTSIVGNDIYGCYRGLSLVSDYTRVVGNTITNNSTGAIYTGSTGYSYCRIIGNDLSDNTTLFEGNSTYGSGNNIFAFNNLTNTTSIWEKAPTSKYLYNDGYVTYSSGSSTGTGGSQTIAHGLSVTPTEVVFTPTASGAAVSAWYADATNIYVTVTNGKTYNWVARSR